MSQRDDTITARMITTQQIDAALTGPKFTPGPWEIGPWVDSLGGNVYRVIVAAGRKVSAVTVYGRKLDGTTGGRLLKHGGHTKTVSVDECDNNAHLVAAAPDLYEALHALMENPDYMVSVGGNPNMVDRMLERARAALAKARGEA